MILLYLFTILGAIALGYYWTRILEKYKEELQKEARHRINLQTQNKELAIELSKTKDLNNALQRDWQGVVKLWEERIVGVEGTEELKKLAGAYKRLVEGYGDDFIVSTETWIDTFASEMDHTDAGKRVQEIRKEVKQRVRERKVFLLMGVPETVAWGNTFGAGTSIDVQADKNLQVFTEILILKLDNLFEEVKRENIGTLKRELTDLVTVVNDQAKESKLKVDPAFVRLKQEELSYAVAAYELKQRYLEEQREIAEQMKEERKALEEAERLKKETEAEEARIRREMEIARKAAASATVEQQGVYAQKMAELEQRLKEAEEQNARAVSMAQLTKRGHVYVISNVGSFGSNIFKIGMTRRLVPQDRVDELGDASVPFRFDVHAMIFSEDAPALEYALHKKFEKNRVNKVNERREFFNVSLADVQRVVEETGHSVHFTLEAEAQQYKESLKLKELGATKG